MFRPKLIALCASAGEGVQHHELPCWTGARGRLELLTHEESKLVQELWREDRLLRVDRALLEDVPVGRRRRERHAAHILVVPRLILIGQGTTRMWADRKSTRLNSSHMSISYAVFC